MKILFQLGREFKLSIAEVCSVFGDFDLVYQDRSVLICEGLDIDKVLKYANRLGGTIKIGVLCEEGIIDLALNHEGKFKYGVSSFGEKLNLKSYLLGLKKDFKSNQVSSRFINKDFKNLSSAQIIGEKLVKSGTDFSIVNFNGTEFLFRSIWVQDIYSYSNRDYSKSRDMQVGMLPPKLCQIMINLSTNSKEDHVVYDPFVGLGTVLIESVYMGNKQVYGSDLSDSMVSESSNNLASLKSKFDFEYHVEKLNAKFINESKYLEKTDSIITEGYLGEIMTKNNVSIDRIDKQRSSLVKIYKAFFENLSKANFKGSIVICFPFWDFKGRYIYFDEIYEILDKYCDILDVFPEDFEDLKSKKGSVLYKRDTQLVGREIFKLTIK